MPAPWQLDLHLDAAKKGYFVGPKNIRCITGVTPEMPATMAAKERQKVADFSRKKWWAWQGLNLRPLRCQHSALPLSYTPTLVSREASGLSLETGHLESAFEPRKPVPGKVPGPAILGKSKAPSGVIDDRADPRSGTSGPPP
jgi:hypothetical protein